MKRSKLAVWSFVLSLIVPLNFLISWGFQGIINREKFLWEIFYQFSTFLDITAIPICLVSIVFSIIALIMIKKYKLRGSNFAVAGFVISFFSIIGLIWFIMALGSGNFG